MRRKRITIQDVAERAAVSRQTVSRVLNSKGEVSVETRQRVERAIADLGYHPNPAAQRLSSNSRSNTIGLIIPYSPSYLYSDPHLLQFLCGVDQIAGQRGFNLLLSTSQQLHNDNAEADLSAYERMVHSAYIDGAIVVEAIVSEAGIALLEQFDYPWVTLGYGLKGRKPHAVHADDRGGARQALMHLLSLGHRRIGIIAGPAEMFAVEERLQGCRLALEDHTLALDADLVVRGDYTPRSGYEGAQLLMVGDNKPTAIFALNDRMAMGAMRYLRDQGIRIPEEVSVVGFDDISFVEECDPSLTTVRQPALEMGHQAARLLLDLIEGYETAMQPIVLPTELVVRNSTRAISNHV